MRRRLNELADVNKKVSEYENKLMLLSQELERVNGNLRLKVDENSQLENNNRMLAQEVEGLKRKIGEYEFSITQEWQAKIVRYTQEIDEYKLKINQCNQDNDNLRNQLNRLSQENEELRRRLSDLQEVNRKISEYESKIVTLSH